MNQVAILGAGELGGLLAHVLARRQIASDVILIDENERAARGKALDIVQAAPVEGFSARVAGTSEVALVAGAAVVAIAEPFGSTALATEPALQLLRRLRDVAPRALVVCAGSSHRDLVDRGVRELHVPRAKLIGSAPEALIAGVRALVAAETRHSPSDVSLTVLGIPPQHIVIPWEDATIGGFGLARVLAEPARRRLDARIPALWPPGPYALSAAAAKVIDVLVKQSKRTATCFVAPDDSAGTRMRTAALPVRLDDSGVSEVVLPEMSARERIQLDNAVLL